MGAFLAALIFVNAATPPVRFGFTAINASGADTGVACLLAYAL
jgi:hypothetical protein